MNNQDEKKGQQLPPQQDEAKDPLLEALLTAKQMQDLHKGPIDPIIRENNLHDRVEKEGEALSANDTGE